MKLEIFSWLDESNICRRFTPHILHALESIAHYEKRWILFYGQTGRSSAFRNKKKDTSMKSNVATKQDISVLELDEEFQPPVMN